MYKKITKKSEKWAIFIKWTEIVNIFRGTEDWAGIDMKNKVKEVSQKLRHEGSI